MAGVAAGALATAVYATAQGWAIVVPTLGWAGGLGAALVIGAIAGLLPALRAARLSPTEALRVRRLAAAHLQRDRLLLAPWSA